MNYKILKYHVLEINQTYVQCFFRIVVEPQFLSPSCVHWLKEMQEQELVVKGGSRLLLQDWTTC